MSLEPNGELVPVGGGDPIPLVRKTVKIGRRDSCDVCLRFANISGVHCELNYNEGYWEISDLGSTNGTKVNGVSVQRKVLSPGDEIAVANRRFTIEFKLSEGAQPPVVEDSGEDILKVSLLERAGLVHKRRDGDEARKPRRPSKPQSQ